MKRIAFIVPYPLHEAPSQRFRFEQYFIHLQRSGARFVVLSFFSLPAWRVLYKEGNLFLKVLHLVAGFAKRCIHITRLFNADFVFIHREAAPLGPPVFEWIITKVLLKQVIYDFDDAIWIPNVSAQNRLAARLKCHWKVKYICKWSYRVSCGNQYLCNYALQYNSRVTYNPTTVDADHLHNPLLYSAREKLELTIGWTGTHSTLPYLNEIVPAIKKLENEFQFKFIVIANQPPDFTLNSVTFIPWNAASEIEDLLQIDIGVMPLTSDAWAEGKCGFKALQFMALEIPVLVSPIGVNKKIIADGENGVFCAGECDWYEKIKVLLLNESLRKNIGKKGRITVREHYSVASNVSNFLTLFEK